ncbi:MAG: LysR family transcriptional regulator [Solirubrobacterales bacterium]|nr:LysR family transcriptional regulator [Solirubrobacterales bacterium]MBV9425120.1 LysR family transcriptional regulator [Solirubrobacterales bacterium]MBV9799655.1 LysR family transcriptional regulator [Solirubrobacterales bacterium]
MLDVDRLRVFREVASRGSFSAAARELAFTQPGISHHVKQLERELGVALIERSPRGIRLTPPGRALYEHAEALLTRLDDAERDVVEIARLGGGTLRMVAFPSAAATLVPPAVASFRARHPSVELKLAEADPPVSLPDLVAGSWDLALAYEYPLLRLPRDPALEFEPMFSDAMACCLPVDHALAGESQIELEWLAGEIFVAPYDCVCREALAHASRRAGFTPDVASETNDYMAMQALVEARVGIAVMPRLVASMAVRERVAIVPLAAGTLTRTASIVSRRAGFRSAASTTMRAVLHEVAAGLAAGPLSLDLPAGGRALVA